MSHGRHLGLWGATGVGVGAIVGGGVLALAGVAFAASGPSAILAFALNGALALVTARSFASLSVAFPQSGGTYTFAKKVLPVETAFIVGWVVWFASIVAAALYALGFAAFAVQLAQRLWPAIPPYLVTGRWPLLALALAATAFYARSLSARVGGGGQWVTIGKVVVFAAVIVAGLVAFARTPPSESLPNLSPFFPHGAKGILQAMGYTFIALQGFDLIAAVAGEVRDPQRNLPRSMYLSLTIALAIYLPLLFCVVTVGLPTGGSIATLASDNPETVIPVAAERFVGAAGWWLVVAAAILAMLSALNANLYGASRVAQAMAHDRTLPVALARLRGTLPARAVLVTSTAAVVVLLAIPSLAVAGAASSLIFLVSFAMVHWATILVRRRTVRTVSDPPPAWSAAERLPPMPVVGAVACLGLAVYQGFAVPEAGGLIGLWLVAGAALYFVKLAPRARTADASAQGADPELQRLRGLSPLVLVPIANPESARSLVSTATALTAPGIGRVLLLSVVRPPVDSDPGGQERQLADVQTVLYNALQTSFEGRLAPQTLITIAGDPRHEIERVAGLYRCETVLLGLGRLDDEAAEELTQRLLGRLDTNVVVLRAPPTLRLSAVRRVLVPVGGRRDQSYLRARLLASLTRGGAPIAIRYLRVLPTDTPLESRERAERGLRELARDETPGEASVEVVTSADPLEVIARAAGETELVVLGIQRRGRRAKTFGSLPSSLARRTAVPILLLSRRG